MSYRHSSYRKLCKAVSKANATRLKSKSGEHYSPPELSRSEMDRVMHWSNQAVLLKPHTWGVQRPRCRQCGTRMEYMDCPTGGWWAHDVHPSDGHDAIRRRAA